MNKRQAKKGKHNYKVEKGMISVIKWCAKATKEDFIQYAKDKCGIDVSLVKSDNPDTFDKLFRQKG